MNLQAGMKACRAWVLLGDSIGQWWFGLKKPWVFIRVPYMNPTIWGYRV